MESYATQHGAAGPVSNMLGALLKNGGDDGFEAADDESSDDEESVNKNALDSFAKEERAEREDYGFEFKGETLSDDQAKRLLILIEHASICPGR